MGGGGGGGWEDLGRKFGRYVRYQDPVFVAGLQAWPEIIFTSDSYQLSASL